MMSNHPRSARMLLVAAPLLWACGQPPAQVEVRTYVGDTFDRRDPALQREALSKVLRTLAPELWNRPQPSVPSEHPLSTPTPHPPRTPGEFEALVDALRRSPIDELSGPAQRLTQAPASLWPEIRAALFEERRAPKGDYRTVLAVIGGDVPNRYGHFALAWKQAHGYGVKVSEDWLEDLLSLPRGKISVPLLPVYRDCILQTALLRAAQNLGQHPDLADEVVSALLDLAYAHQGTFRDEISRSLVAMGSEAMPALIEASAEANAPDRQPALARFILDKMDRLHPRQALAAVQSQPRLLERVLTAYGHARFVEAPAALLDFVDDRSPPVRSAAREAFEAYVTGAAPRAKQRSVRLLGGATGTAKAFLTYRARAALAIRERLAEVAPALLEEPCAMYLETREVDPLCEAQPARLTASYFARLDADRRARADRIITEALADEESNAAADALNRLLAEDPDPEGSDRLIAFFRQRALDLESNGEAIASAAEFRKAAMLARAADPATADDLEVRALLNEARSPELEHHGREMLIRTAIERQPDDLRVRDAWTRVQASAAGSIAGPAPWRFWWVALAGLTMLLVVLSLTGRALRRVALRSPPS